MSSYIRLFFAFSIAQEIDGRSVRWQMRRGAPTALTQRTWSGASLWHGHPRLCFAKATAEGGCATNVQLVCCLNRARLGHRLALELPDRA
jgi:hypothetical protein